MGSLSLDEIKDQFEERILDLKETIRAIEFNMSTQGPRYWISKYEFTHKTLSLNVILYQGIMDAINFQSAGSDTFH